MIRVMLSNTFAAQNSTIDLVSHFDHFLRSADSRCSLLDEILIDSSVLWSLFKGDSFPTLQLAK
jgi:hypothetical protein